MMQRRAFIVALGLGTFGLQGSSSGQPGRRVPRIGIPVFAGTMDEITGPNPSRPSVRALIHGLRELGYVYGRDFETEPRAGEGRPERWPAIAAELVRSEVDVIVAPGPILPALKRATSTIPIVMAAATDPVGDGYARSLGRPGGNFTGLSLQEVDGTGTRLELLKELVPGAAPVAVLWNNVNRDSARYWEAAQAAARKGGWTLVKLEIRDVRDLNAAFQTARNARAGGLLAIASALLFNRARQVADLAAGSRLPAMYALRAYVDAGGLMSYGADIDDIWRRAAGFVDKILKGSKPADLPVEQPTKFELVINVRTAMALGIKIPKSVLLRADEVIH